jgi:hypothetical protein
MYRRRESASASQISMALEPQRRLLASIGLAALLIAMTAHASIAIASNVEPLPTTIETLAPGLHRLGTARHTVFGFHVFNATLWVVGRQWSPAEAHALDVEASRNIPPSRLIDGVIDEMRDIKAADDRQRSIWKQRLNQIIPALARGDQLVILCLPDQRTVVFYNGTKVGSVDDPNFGAALFRIWLDPNASRQDFRNALLQN